MKILLPTSKACIQNHASTQKSWEIIWQLTGQIRNTGCCQTSTSQTQYLTLNNIRFYHFSNKKLVKAFQTINLIRHHKIQNNNQKNQDKKIQQRNQKGQEGKPFILTIYTILDPTRAYNSKRSYAIEIVGVILLLYF